MKESKPIIIMKKKPQEERKVVDPEENKAPVTREMGERIRMTREKKEMSQKDLAHAMNKDLNTVTSWESGKAVFSESTAKKFEGVLGISLGRK